MGSDREVTTGQGRDSEAGARAESHYRSLLHAVPDILLRIRPDGTVLDCHAPDAALLWFNPDEVLGRRIGDVFPKEFHDLCVEHIERTLSGGHMQTFEFSGWGEHSDEHWEARMTVCGEDEVLFLTREIGDRKRTEIALREKGRFLSTLLSNMPGYMYRCRNDRDWTPEFVSGGVEAVTGYPRSQFTPEGGLNLGDVVLEDDRESVWNGVQTAIARREPFQLTYRITTAAGVERWVWERGRAIFDEKGEVVALEGFITDITALKRAEEEVLRSNERQRVLLRELDHRVRNNLTSLGALVDISSRGATDAQQLAASIRSRVQAMYTAHGLLSRSHHAPLDLRELLKALIPIEFGDRVEFSGPKVLIPTRQTATLGMVIQEMIANCLKHGALRSPNGRVSASWRPLEPEGTLELHWVENGGEPIREPERKGIGTTLIEGLVRTELRGSVELTYPETGADHRLVMQLDPADDPPYFI